MEEKKSIFGDFVKSLFVIAIAIVLVLTGFAAGKYYTNKKAENKENNKVEDKKLEVPEEVSRAIDELWSTDYIDSYHDSIIELINLEDKDALDVKKYLEDNYNDYLIFYGVKEATNNYVSLTATKEQILAKTKEKYGYDFDLKFHDIYDMVESDKPVGLKWDSKNESYTYDPETGAWQRGCDFFCDDSQVLIDVLDIKNNGNNTYTVTTNQIWTDWEIGRECSVSGEFYANAKDIVNNKTVLSYNVPNNAIGPKEFEKFYKTDDECNIDALNIADYVFEQAKGKLNKYEYKVSYEDGKIKILNFKKVN